MITYTRMALGLILQRNLPTASQQPWWYRWLRKLGLTKERA